MDGPIQSPPLAPGRERFAWAMFDFANSGYTTVVLTTVFNAYFVGVVAVSLGPGTATLLWTLALGLSNGLVLLSAPVLGAMADATGAKKRFLVVTTVGCIAATAALAWVGPGAVAAGVLLLVLSNFFFASGENLIAAFLPELSAPEHMGRLSAQGWAIGYLGGLGVLALSLWWASRAQAAGLGAAHYVPEIMLLVAGAFALASLPTFIWLRERAPKRAMPRFSPLVRQAWQRLGETWAEAHRYRDLFRFLLALATYNCGIYTVIVLAAVFAQQAMGFGLPETMLLIMVVNVTAALGALIFGYLQDRIGSLTAVRLTLLVWIAAIGLAWLSQDRGLFWVSANLVGIALGSSQSAGRALIGQLTPGGRDAEFFGLWGVAMKCSAVVGPLVYGLISWWTAGDHRTALLSTLIFFVAGLFLTRSVDELRGRAAARA